ncbi:L-erythrulose kinase [Microbacterium lemovicicum]|uniref:L-erythrulose kinase n=1 Tax=Microbacterium lemovicicum TaxID=1072463 RepID=A0A3Q9J2X7_9MICO|nr:dihydroxyacetone kinase subunit DhaL [Microbacterium lemovicicum]AZS38120.1 L-erythrulose kinase [Microbacterium lemovicicum]
MTRILSEPETFARDALAGFVTAHADVVRAVDGGVVRRHRSAPGRVAVLIGGGSGHFPAFAGYVGEGMAAGAVCGNIFSSPSTGQAMRVAHAADAGGGILFAYGNYAGDVMHFGEAERRLRDEGVDARTVLLTDDVASAPRDARDQRRGIAGIVFAFHIAGAAADRGDDLDSVERLVRLTNERTVTFGVAFSGCTLPGADASLFEVPAGMMSLGLGIHGEPGIEDVPLQTAPDLAATLLQPLLAERPADANRVALIVNGLGSVKYEELFVLFGEVSGLLDAQGITVVQPLCGELVTSLDMGGASVSLLWLDDELEELWAAAAAAPAFHRGAVAPRTGDAEQIDDEPAVEGSSGIPSSSESVPAGSVAAAETAIHLLRVAHDVVGAHEAELGALDAIAGDGDHGVGMVRGLDAAVTAAERSGAAAGLSAALTAAGEGWAERAGGASGALWGAALAQLGTSLGDHDQYPPALVADAVDAAVERIRALGGAEAGDKTMLDAMAPFAASLRQGIAAGEPVAGALRAAAATATGAAEATAALVPRRGRARPLAERSVGHADPGATSFAMIVDAVAARVEKGS